MDPIQRPDSGSPLSPAGTEVSDGPRAALVAFNDTLLRLNSGR